MYPEVPIYQTLEKNWNIISFLGNKLETKIFSTSSAIWQDCLALKCGHQKELTQFNSTCGFGKSGYAFIPHLDLICTLLLLKKQAFDHMWHWLTDLYPPTQNWVTQVGTWTKLNWYYNFMVVGFIWNGLYNLTNTTQCSGGWLALSMPSVQKELFNKICHKRNI